jgi:uncharacterized protein YdhG (YjbR/CyaY superfamily)
MEAASAGLPGYTGTKGSLHFPLDKPIPYELTSQAVKFRVAENQEAP